MKNLKLISTMFLFLLICQVSNAQSEKENRGLKTEMIKVGGMCNMDKKRIEKAAYSVEGVKKASWSVETDILTLEYESFRKGLVDEVQKKIAEKGNDTEKYKADDKVYNALPQCCHYRE